MEKIIRNRDNPKLRPILDNWLIWGNRWKNSSLRNKWKWNKSLKKNLDELLVELTDNRCAFCDYFPVENTAHLKEGLSIEHFYPKDRSNIYSIYAYQWENLFPICQKCNNVKGDDYSCYILKPDEAHYNFDHYFILVGDGELDANPSKNTEIQNRAKETIKTYALNRGELREERRKKVELFESLMPLYSVDIILEIRPLEYEPYRFFIKRFIDNGNIQTLEEIYDELKNLNIND